MVFSLESRGLTADRCRMRFRGGPRAAYFDLATVSSVPCRVILTGPWPLSAFSSYDGVHADTYCISM